MTPEELRVVQAALAARDFLPSTGMPAFRALRDAADALSDSCRECNAGGHTCPGDGNSIPHGATDCGEHADSGMAEWKDATFSQVLAGDRLRLGGVEAECETSSVGQWHVKPGDRSWEYNGNTYYNDTPYDEPKTEVWLRLKGRDGRMQFPSNGAVEILCDAERRAILDLQRASLNPSVNAPNAGDLR